ncbi:hypothetical protein AYI69_g8741 [Smittium culicis]|uniref:CCHC-type domain-containing protein n=1 Tax=Smittium culicis TaxID=133412 RepID=A0A1R1XHG7_9FUNG|nr:hypothetical protein AYI69_g8741 [Smittium culicis]
MSTNSRINTDLFPKKFSGSEADVKIIDIWINRFSTAVSLNLIEDKKAIDIFRLWTEGLAAEWQNDMETISNTLEWTLKDWLDKLKAKFVKKIDQKGNIFALLKFQKQETEGMDTYNNRFRKYVSTIPAEMKTDGLIKKIYSDILLQIDKDLWWSCSKLDEKSDLEKLMKVTSKIMEIKEQAKPVEFANVPNKPESLPETERRRMQNSIDQLTKKMKRMSVLTQKEAPKREYSQIICYTCNKKGHTSRICKSLRGNEENEAKPSENKKIMLAIH